MKALNILKKIRASKRGLTFSVNSDNAKIGQKYHYFIDKNEKCVHIIPDEAGNLTASRKKCGKEFKPLFDIRSKEVKELVSSADYLEVEDAGSEIIVHVFQKIRELIVTKKSNIISIADILCQQTGEIILDKAVGESNATMSFGRPTLWNDNYFEYLSSQVPTRYNFNTKKNRDSVKNIYDVCSLFSGAGLLDFSFKDPQFRFVFANDFCMIDGKQMPEIAETYENNMGHKMIVKDICELKSSEIPNSDIVLGGSCCQGFSSCVIDKERRYSDNAESKRSLVAQFVRIINDKNPKCFVLENVPELLSESSGKYFKEYIVDALPEYEITATVVKDSEVGGYSVRRRAIVIGSRIGKIELPSVRLSAVKTVRDALMKVDSTWPNFNENSNSKEGTQMLMSYVPDGGNWESIPEDIVIKYRSSHTPFKKGQTQSSMYSRLDPNQPSKTIVNWRKTVMMPPKEFVKDGERQLSVSEVAAIMGLPKEFKFFGS